MNVGLCYTLSCTRFGGSKIRKTKKEGARKMAEEGGIKRHRTDIDMTRGSIPWLLIGFAIPMLIGNLFQQLYNTVDSYVVGNYVGQSAFAAVGNVGPILNTAIGFFSGFATGAGVVIGQYAGAKDEKRLEDTVSTTIAVSLILCVVFTIICTLSVPFMLDIMNMPDSADGDSVRENAAVYLRIYFLGMTGLMLYNIGAGILRAVGNSVIPLIALVISAVINIVLDLSFVLGLHMGADGVAYATIIAQACSAAYILFYLTRSRASYRIVWRKLHIDRAILSKIIRIGIPTAVQLAITAFSNVFVQSYINAFDKDCMAGWASYNKIDAFAMLPMQSISLAVTTFVSQNYGAGQPERSRKGATAGIIISLIITVTLIIPIMFFADGLVAIFNDEGRTVEFGALFLRYISPFYVLCLYNQIIAGVLRGAGESRAPMLIMLGSFVVFRQVYLFTLSRLSSSVMVITFAYPAGWALCSLLMFLYYKFAPWEARHLEITGKKPAEAAQS